MKASELLQMSISDLNAKLDELYREQFNLRFQHAQNKLTKTSEIARVRREIARIKTVQHQKQLAAAAQAN
jgi:large subunit ribosomal protein L29